ncbi:terminase [Nakamurella antarctica]|uniref:Terminase n=1 Tax=Nakamurella antarctica TaxID=1902245 RepID=A0A3G8ZML2_9ACTN|nr:terminase [Nakamurella antarctica]AZI58388.1 terminase [Nakamurella antarctica]
MQTLAPSGLAARGRQFWETTNQSYDLTESELALLTETCRTMDNLDALAAAIKSEGAMTVGSTGQLVVNPALTEARGQRLALHRLIASLALPDIDGATVNKASSIRGKTAAKARWNGHVKERGA